MIKFHNKKLYGLYLAVMIFCTVAVLLSVFPMNVCAAEEQDADAVVEDAAQDVHTAEKLALFDLTADDLSGENLMYTLTHLNAISYVILAMSLILIVVVIVVIIVIVKKLKDSFSYV